MYICISYEYIGFYLVCMCLCVIGERDMVGGQAHTRIARLKGGLGEKKKRKSIKKKKKT